MQDLEWAPDGSGLASGSIDNSVVLWDVATGRGALRLEGHKHFVQGCAWDPAGRYVATQSADRTVRYAPFGAHAICSNVLQDVEPPLVKRWLVGVRMAAGSTWASSWPHLGSRLSASHD